MFEISVESTFTAAHRHLVPGLGESLHGHDFLVVVRMAGPDLADDVLVDFHAVEAELRRLLGELSHRDLSLVPDLGPGPASPARLARWLFQHLAPSPALGQGVLLSSVEVRDTPATGARYQPG